MNAYRDIEIPSGFEELCIRKVPARSLEKTISIRKTAVSFGTALIRELDGVFQTHRNVTVLISDMAIRICLTQDRRPNSRRLWISRNRQGAVHAAGVSSDLVPKALAARGFVVGVAIKAEILPRLAPSDPVIIHAALRRQFRKN